MPTLLAPAHNATNVNNEIKLDWNTAANASSYDVQVSSYSDFNSLLIDEKDVESTHLNQHVFVPGNSYYWRIRSSNGNEASEWSSANNFSTIATTSQQITFDILKTIAFTRSQQPHVAPIIEPISQLDPPKQGGKDAPGLVFEEANAIIPFEVHPPDKAYAVVRPRAALDKQSVRVWVDKEKDSFYELRNYESSKPNYSSNVITPPINETTLPEAAHVFSRLNVGYQKSSNDFPISLTTGANGYSRFIGLEELMEFGASHRIAAHNVFQNEQEDFPYFTDLYFSLLDQERAQILGLVEAEDFTGAVRMVFIPGPSSKLEVSVAFYARRFISINNEPFTGPIAYSSMFWQDETDTPGQDNDEAHDTDFLTVGYDSDGDGLADYIRERNIMNPHPLGLEKTEFLPLAPNHRLSYIGMENRDRYEDHYSAFSSAKYHLRVSHDIHITEQSRNLKLILLEDSTSSEYFDNIAFVVALAEDWPKAQSVSDALTVTYTTNSYYPEDQDGDGLTDQFEQTNGLEIHNMDTDGDGVSDREQLDIESISVNTDKLERPLTQLLYELHAPHPNPFNLSSSFKISVREDQHLNVSLYNALGQRVQSIYSGFIRGNEIQRFTIEANNLPSGLYF